MYGTQTSAGVCPNPMSLHAAHGVLRACSTCHSKRTGGGGGLAGLWGTHAPGDWGCSRPQSPNHPPPQEPLEIYFPWLLVGSGFTASVCYVSAPQSHQDSGNLPFDSTVLDLFTGWRTGGGGQEGRNQMISPQLHDVAMTQGGRQK